MKKEKRKLSSEELIKIITDTMEVRVAELFVELEMQDEELENEKEKENDSKRII